MVRACNPNVISPAAPTPGARRRVAVIGLGLAGCTAAHFLHKNGDEVACFEALPCPGLYAHSVVVSNAETAAETAASSHVTTPIQSAAPATETLCDVPLRAVSPHYYANYWQLLRHLNVAVQQVNYEGVFLDHRASSDTTEALAFGYRNTLLFGRWAVPLPILASLRHVRVLIGYLAMIILMPWYLWARRAGAWIAARLPLPRELCDLLTPTDPCDVSMEEYFERGHGAWASAALYHRDFTHGFFYPMMSTLLSCSYAQVRQYPAALLGEFMLARCTTLLTGWFRVTGGVQSVAERLLLTAQTGPDAMRCLYSTRVVRVESISGAPGAAPAGVRVTYQKADGTETIEHFDAVVVAVEPDVARRIVVAATAEQKFLLGATDTYTATIVAHRDATLMPRDASLWAPMNVYGDVSDAASPRRDGPASTTTAHFSAILAAANGGKLAASPPPQSSLLASPTADVSDAVAAVSPVTGATLTSGSGDVFETWNPRVRPQEDSVIKEVRMTRSVWGVRGFAAYRAMAPVAQGQGGIYFAGSYCARGVTLLEQACTSGLEAAMDLGAAVPFEVFPGAAPAPLNPVVVLISAWANAALLSVALWITAAGFILRTARRALVRCLCGSAAVSAQTSMSKRA